MTTYRASGLPRNAGNPAPAFQTALALQRRGRLGEAARLYEAILRADRGNFDALLNLAFVRIREGKPEDSARLSRKALYLKPNSAEAHNRLGLAVQALGHADEAMTRFEKAIALKPDFAEAYFNLGVALQLERRTDEAVAQYEKAIAVKPDYVEAHSNCATIFAMLGRWEEALVLYQRLREIDGGSAATLNNLGNVLKELGRHGEATAHYEKALALDPRSDSAYHNFGITLAEMGRIDEARRAFEKAAEIAPHKPGHYLHLVNAIRSAPGDRHLAAMEDLARDEASLEPGPRIELQFALAKAYADLGEHERSFRHLLDGSALNRRRIVYDETATLGAFERIPGLFTAELMRAKRGGGDPTSVPVFILGMPRSGTTLVEQILASHPQVHGAGERMDFEQGLAAAARDANVPYPELVRSLDAEQLRGLGSRYVEGMRRLAAGAARISDKMPGNFRYAGLIHLALPNARIIHTRRDPIDTCLSSFSILFTGDQPHTYDLAELGRYYRAYERLMEHWRAVLPHGVMIEVQYEDVVADLAAQARRIVAHCGLEWDDACLNFQQSSRPVRTASQAQVRQPIYRSSIGRWKPYAHLLRPLLAELGVNQPTILGDGVGCRRNLQCFPERQPSAH